MREEKLKDNAMVSVAKIILRYNKDIPKVYLRLLITSLSCDKICSGKPGNRCWSYWGVSRPTCCRYDFGILEVISLYIFIDISHFVQIMFFMTLASWRYCHITL